MSKVCVKSFSLSLDGYGAGPDQRLEHPLGVGGEALHKWLFANPAPALDAAIIKSSLEDAGAWIIGRHMFGPIRGAWPDANWKGWWGDNPPYHCPVFVLTHHPRESFSMEGGTTFHFVTDGLHAALARARAAAGSKEVRIGGGASVIRQYLTAGLIDELHLAISPVLLGSGEALLSGLDLIQLGFHVAEFSASPNAAHYVMRKK